MSASQRIQPIPELEGLQHAIVDRVRRAADALSVDAQMDFAGPLVPYVARAALVAAGADEGTIWLLDQDRRALIPAFNNGSRSAEWVGTFEQPLDRGIISMVLATGQAISERTTGSHEAWDRSLDERLGVHTLAMVAAPLRFGSRVRGVLTGVRLCPPREAMAAGFSVQEREGLEVASVLLGDLWDLALLRRVTGVDQV